MKRLYIAGALLILVIITYIVSLNYIKASYNEANNLLDTSVNAYKQQKTAEKETEELNNLWEKKEKILSAFVNHDRIDDIEKAISLLNLYSKSPNNQLFYEYADTVKILLHQIMEDTKITAHSIF